MEAARLGLCANCLNVVTCGFPNARHGVVQCEEYILDEAGVVSPVKKDRAFPGLLPSQLFEEE